MLSRGTTVRIERHALTALLGGEDNPPNGAKYIVLHLRKKATGWSLIRRCKAEVSSRKRRGFFAFSDFSSGATPRFRIDKVKSLGAGVEKPESASPVLERQKKNSATSARS